MQPEKEGRFCNSCNKTVIDFTEMTDSEVANYFNDTRLQNTCGRFTDAQLNSHGTEAILDLITKISQTDWTFIKKTAAAILMCFAFAQGIQAQVSKDTIVVQSICYTVGKVVANPAAMVIQAFKKPFPNQELPVITTDKIKIVTVAPGKKEGQSSKTKKPLTLAGMPSNIKPLLFRNKL